jgi:hypothetical protein
LPMPSDRTISAGGGHKIRHWNLSESEMRNTPPVPSGWWFHLIALTHHSRFATELTRSP